MLHLHGFLNRINSNLFFTYMIFYYLQSINTKKKNKTTLNLKINLGFLSNTNFKQHTTHVTN